MARVLLGVSGGIAAYKALELARLAIKAGHVVRVIQTEGSEQFVGRASFEAITGAPVLTSEFERDPARGAYPGEAVPERAPISHLALVDRAQLLVIAPATANTIAKLAHGHADNLLTTAALAASCPVLLAPAMNNRMYLHPATAANLELLERRGVKIIPPNEGSLASHGEHGIGRLAEPGEILAACESELQPAGSPSDAFGPAMRAPGPSWSSVRVLVTAGGTREPIDSVRYIGNRSSGRMGVALAARAAARGAEVTLIGANLSVPAPPGVRLVVVTTAAELADACAREFEHCDVLLMSAAVADFRPTEPPDGKIKKDEGVPRLELEPTVDVLSTLAAGRHQGQLIVGFAAEHGEGAIAYGRRKLEHKGLDAIVVNDISQPGIGFDSETNEVTIITASGSERGVPRADKHVIADAILDELQELRPAKGEQGDGAGNTAGAR